MNRGPELYQILVNWDRCDKCLLCENYLPGFITENLGEGIMERETTENWVCWDNLYAAFFKCPQRAMLFRRIV